MTVRKDLKRARQEKTGETLQENMRKNANKAIRDNEESMTTREPPRFADKAVQVPESGGSVASTLKTRPAMHTAVLIAAIAATTYFYQNPQGHLQVPPVHQLASVDSASPTNGNVNTSISVDGIRRIACTGEPFVLNRLQLKKGEEVWVCLGAGHPDLKVRGLSSLPGVFYVENLLSDREIDLVVRRAVPMMRKSQVLDERERVPGKHLMDDDEWRSSRSVVYSDTLTRSLGSRVGKLLRIPADFVQNSTFQVQRYGTSEHYYPHYDTHPLSKLGKQKTIDFPDFPWSARFATVVMYLDTAESGHTFFPFDGMTAERAHEMATIAATKHFVPRWKKYCSRVPSHRPGINIKPKKGDAVVFYNHHVESPDLLGDRDPLSYHGSCDILPGQIKTMANLWLQVPPSNFGAEALLPPPKVDLSSVKSVLKWFDNF